MRALFVDVELDIGKIDHMQPDRSAVAGHLAGQIHHLLLRPVAGVRGRVKIDRVDLHTTLGDHPACHRRIDSAGQKKHALAVGSHRHSAGAGNFNRIHIDFFPDLDIQHHLRIMHVHLHLRIGVQKHAAHFAVHLHGFHGVVLSRPPRIHLKGKIPVRIGFSHVRDHSAAQTLKAFVLQLDHRADLGDAEHGFQSLNRFLIIIALGKDLHIYPASGAPDSKFSLAPLQRVTDLPDQGVLKDAAVSSLHTDFRILNQKRSEFHNTPFSRDKCSA